MNAWKAPRAAGRAARPESPAFGAETPATTEPPLPPRRATRRQRWEAARVLRRAEGRRDGEESGARGVRYRELRDRGGARRRRSTDVRAGHGAPSRRRRYGLPAARHRNPEGEPVGPFRRGQDVIDMQLTPGAQADASAWRRQAHDHRRVSARRSTSPSRVALPVTGPARPAVAGSELPS